MKRRLQVLALVVCLGVAGSAARAEQRQTADGSVHGDEGSTVQVAGTVVGASGRPVVGAHVTATLFDDDSGAPVQHPILAGSAITRPDGTFSLAVSPSAAVRSAARRNGGTVALDLFVKHAGVATVVVVNREVGDRSSGSFAPAARSRPPVTVVLDTSSPRSETSWADAPNVLWPPPCHAVRRLLSTSSAYARVGELHLTQDETGSFSYGERADTTVQVKVQLSAGGKWTAGGSVEVGNTRQSSVSWPKGSSNGRVLSTSFTFRKYKVDYQPNGACDSRDYWEIRATQWEGGAGLEEYVDDFDNHCDDAYRDHARHFAPGVSYSTGSQHALTWSFGAAVFGVGLSTSSGFSRWVTHSWRFGDNWRWYHLCGPGNVPNVAARIFSGPATNGSPFDA